MKHARALLTILFLACVSPCLAAGEKALPSVPLSGHFPAGTLFYVECPSVPDFVRGFKGTGLYAIWNDPSVSALRTALEESGKGADLDMLRSFKDFAAGVPGGMAFGLAGAPGGHGWLVVVQIGPDSSAAKALLDKVYVEEARQGYPVEHEEAFGTTLTISTLDGECSAFADQTLFLGTREMLSAALERIRADSTENTLSSSLEFTKAASFLSARPAYRMFLDVQRVMSAVQAATPLDETMTPVFDAFISEFGLSDIETASLEASFTASGVLERVCISTKTADSRFIDIVGRAKADESRLRLVPRSAFACAATATDPKFSWMVCRNLLAAFSGVAKRAGTADAAAPPEFDVFAHMGELATKSGVDVDRDVIPALGINDISYVVLPETLAPGAPPAGLEQVVLVEVKDEKAISTAIGKIAKTAKQNPYILFPQVALGTPPPATIETATLGTLAITYLDIKTSPLVSPAVAVYGGYLIYANSKEVVKNVVDNLIAPGPGIVDSEDYKRVRAVLPAGVVQVGYFSIDRCVDLFYDLAVPFIRRAVETAGAEGKTELAAAVPPSSVIKKNVDGIGSSVVTAGNLVDVQIYSPAGLAPIVAGVLGAVFMAQSDAGGKELVQPGGEINPPREHLVEIGRLLQVSSIERKGNFPGMLADVVPPELLQAPQDPAADSPIDYEYVPGLTTSSPGRRVLVYERDGLNPDGRHVLYVDGSVEFVKEEDFRKLTGENAQ